MAYTPSDKDRSTVQALAAFGIPNEEIARLVGSGIGEDELLRHHADDLRIGATKGGAKIQQALYERATKGDTAAAKILLAQSNKRSMDSMTVTTEELSSWTGITIQNIKEHKLAGTITPLERDKWALKSTMLALMARYRDIAAGKVPVTDQQISAARERARLTKLRADSEELDLAQKRGRLIDVEAAESEIFAIGRAWRDAWMNWPSKVAPSVAHDTGAPLEAVLESLERHVDRQIEELGEPGRG